MSTLRKLQSCQLRPSEVRLSLSAHYTTIDQMVWGNPLPNLISPTVLHSQQIRGIGDITEKGWNAEKKGGKIERERERESFPFIVLKLPPHPLMPHLAKTLFVRVRCECRPSYKLLSYLDDKRNHIRDCFACSTAVKRQRERGEGEV